MNENIKTIQEALGLIPDGIYSDVTRQAVADFQAANNLPVTGEVDSATWDTLKSKQERDIEQLDLNIKSKGIEHIVEAMADVICTFVKDFPQDLEHICLYIQEISSLPQTGKLDKETWNVLVCIFNQQHLKN
jgi:hypothetical protein